jgi:Holliday junction resolvase-like predicted endonuclease
MKLIFEVIHETWPINGLLSTILKTKNNKMNKIGKFGEDIACMFLMKHGYKIVERNYSRKWGELDIVAKKAGKICFVEVKTVSCEMSSEIDGFSGISGGCVTRATGYRPEDNMNKRKITKFLRIIQTYIVEKHMEKVEWSMALVAMRVDTAKKKAKVRFIENLVL